MVKTTKQSIAKKGICNEIPVDVFDGGSTIIENKKETLSPLIGKTAGISGFSGFYTFNNVSGILGQYPPSTTTGGIITYTDTINSGPYCGNAKKPASFKKSDIIDFSDELPPDWDDISPFTTLTKEEKPSVLKRINKYLSSLFKPLTSIKFKMK